MNYIEREYISSSSHALCPKLNYVYASAYAAVIPSALCFIPYASSASVLTTCCAYALAYADVFRETYLKRSVCFM